MLEYEKDREAREKADQAANELLAEEEKQKESGEPARGQQQEAASKKKKVAKAKKRKGDVDAPARALDDTAHNDGDDTAATALPEVPPASKVELQLSVGTPRVEARTSAAPAPDGDDGSKPAPAGLSRAGAPAPPAKGADPDGESASGSGAAAEDEWEVVTKVKRKAKKSASEPDDSQAAPSSDAGRVAAAPRRAAAADPAARGALAVRAKASQPASSPLQEALGRPAGGAVEGSPANASECDSKSEAGSSSASSATGTGTPSDTTAACPGAGPAQHAFAMWADATIPPGPRVGIARPPEPAAASAAAAAAAPPAPAARGRRSLTVPPDWPALSPSCGPSAPPAELKPAGSGAPKPATSSPGVAAATVASAVSAAASAVSALSTAAAAASASASAASAPSSEPPRPASRSWASLVKKDLKEDEQDEPAKAPAMAKGYTLLGGAASLTAAAAAAAAPANGAVPSSTATTAAVAAATGSPSAVPDAASASVQPLVAGEAQACGCQADMSHTCSLSTQTSPPPSPTGAPLGFARPARGTAAAPRTHAKEAEAAPASRAPTRTQPSGASSAPPTPVSTKPKPPAWSAAAPRPRALMIPSSNGPPPPASPTDKSDQPAGARPERPLLPDSHAGAFSYSQATACASSTPSPRAAGEPPPGTGGAPLLPPAMPSYSQAAGGSSGGEPPRPSSAAPFLLDGPEQPTGHTQPAGAGLSRPSSRSGRESGSASAGQRRRPSSPPPGTGGAPGGAAVPSLVPAAAAPGLAAPASVPISPMQAAMNRLQSQLYAYGPAGMLARPMVRVPTSAHPYAAGAPAGPLLWMQPAPAGIFFGPPVGGRPEQSLAAEDAPPSDDERAALAFGQWAASTKGGGAGVAIPVVPGGHLVRTPLLQPSAEAPPRADGRSKAGRGGKRAELPGFARSHSVGSRSAEPPPGQPLPTSVPSSPMNARHPEPTAARQGVQMLPARMLPLAQGQAAPPLNKPVKKAAPAPARPSLPASLGNPPLSPASPSVPAPPRPRLSKLHDEIFAFAQASILSGEAAHAEVMSILASLRAVVSARWAQATVELYGSRSTGLSLASSDVDVTLLGVPTGPGRDAISAALRDLHADLSSEPWVTSQTLVLSARIPVLKIKSATGVPVDVTISDSAQHTGLLARDLVLGYLHQAPQLTPLVIVLKSFLRELGLNDPYMGGMSSYSLVVLLWLFVCESAHRGYATTDLGYQLLGFFSMFLYRFESQPTHVDDPLSPMISGPGEVRENIMHSCYQIGRVCRSFHRALQLLSTDQPAWTDDETPLLPRLFSDVAGLSRATQTEPPSARPSADAACNTSARTPGPPASPCSTVVASVVEALTMQLEASARAPSTGRPFAHAVSPTVVAAAATAAALASPSRTPAPMSFSTMASQTHGPPPAAPPAAAPAAVATPAPGALAPAAGAGSSQRQSSFAEEAPTKQSVPPAVPDAAAPAAAAPTATQAAGATPPGDRMRASPRQLEAAQHLRSPGGAGVAAGALAGIDDRGPRS